MRDSLGTWLRARAQPWEVAAFVWGPASVLAFALWYLLRSREALGDFPIFRAASSAVLDGRTPYPATTAALANFDQFVYPPMAAFLFTPVAVLPYTAGEIVLFVLGVAATLASLRLLGVEDWRCYGLAAVSAPVVGSVTLGAFTPFLLLATAATWRYRRGASASGMSAALATVVKLFLWPLGVWLLATHRLRAFAVFATVGLASLLLSWAAIGFAGFASYPHLLGALARLEGWTGYSPAAFLGLSGTPSTLLSAALCLAVVVAIWRTAHGEDGDRRSFAVAVIGAVVATPVIWLHYFALLFVPIALYRPRLSGLWFVPLVLWATPAGHSEGSAWRIALALLVTAVVAVRTLRPASGPKGEALPAVAAADPI